MAGAAGGGRPSLARASEGVHSGRTRARPLTAGSMSRLRSPGTPSTAAVSVSPSKARSFRYHCSSLMTMPRECIRVRQLTVAEQVPTTRVESSATVHAADGRYFAYSDVGGAI